MPQIYRSHLAYHGKRVMISNITCSTYFEVVNAHGKHFCALPREDEDIAKWQAQGVQTFILGDDRGKIYRHLSASLATSKQKGMMANAYSSTCY